MTEVSDAVPHIADGHGVGTVDEVLCCVCSVYLHHTAV